MTNPQRGEVEIEIDGARHTLKLTLGALAEIEAVLGVSGFKALAERLGTLSAGDLTDVLGALLRAGGSNADPRGTSPSAAAAAVAAAFKMVGP